MGIAPENVMHSALRRCTASGPLIVTCKRRSPASSIVLNRRRAHLFTRYCDDCHYAGTCWLTMIFSVFISDGMKVADGP
jgi:hypothetical protein